MDGACGMYGEKRNEYRRLVGKPVGKRPLERLKNIWVIILKWTVNK
jgi:hypothetical protein